MANEEVQSSKTRDGARTVVIIAVMTAVSALGGLVKLGTPVGSVALDSSAGYFSAAYYSPLIGAIVGFLGHLASSATAGFPLSWLHLVIGVLQGVWSAIYGAIIRKVDRTYAVVVAAVLATILNGVVAPLILALISPQLRDMLHTLIPLLTVASLINIAVASATLLTLAKVQSSRI
jgi:uncharacterized membrane protein